MGEFEPLINVPLYLSVDLRGRAAPSPDARNRHVLVLDSVSPPARRAAHNAPGPAGGIPECIVWEVEGPIGHLGV
jgi:hypothetical protein